MKNSGKKIKLKLTMVLLVTLLFVFTAAGVEPVLAYDDIKGHWARQAVTRASSLDFIKGYPDNTFKPEKEISQMEALVLFMRACGYDNETTAKKKARPELALSNKKVPLVPWGQAYMDSAVQNDLLPDIWLSAFNPTAPANRAQVASLIARLLQLPLADDSSANSFSDSGRTALDYLPYIAAVSNAGIMKGYGDGTFRPQNGMKRGEAAAALLKSLMEQNWVIIEESRIIEGWVQKISLDKNIGEMELMSLTGVQKIKLSPMLICFGPNGEECKPQEALNYQVEVLLNQKKQAECITLLEKKERLDVDNKITGTVKSVIIGVDSVLVLSDLNCEERRLPLSWSAVIENEGKSKARGFDSLKSGTFVRVHMMDGQAALLSVLDTQTISGTIASLTGKRLTLASKGSSKIGKPEWFNYWDRARIVDRDGLAMSGVIRGDKIKVTYLDPYPGEIDDEIPLEIVVTSRPELKGKKGEIEKISVQGDSLRIWMKKNKEYTVDQNVKVYEGDGSEISFSGLKVGNKVEMQIDGASVIMAISLPEWKQVQTEVVQTVISNNTYTIKVTRKEYPVDNGVEVYAADGSAIAFSNLNANDKVVLYVDDDGVVRKITR
jgi:hypothetical protein